jgi:hypothetical protein
MPEACGKCGTNLNSALQKFTNNSHIKASVIEEAILVTETQEDLSDSDFDSLMEEQPEPVSRQEIMNSFLAEGTNRGFKVKDLVPPELLEKISKKETKATKRTLLKKK